MSAPQKFRSALNGFNREDVASYLEYLNSKHTAQVNQLTSEADFLRSKLDAVQPADDQSEIIHALEAERDDLRAQLEEMKAHCAALEQALEEVGNTPVAVCAAPAASVTCTAAEELEIYRRAERTERMAKERADLIYRQTNGVLNEASIRVNEMADQVVPIADQILMQIGQLQNAVNASKQSLQDAIVIMNTLRPDNT